jgi:transcriptional regulator with GAF, ATPase, and Fis domain
MLATTQNLDAENDLHEQIVVLQAAHRIALVLSKTQRVEEAVEKLILEFFNLAKADEGSIQLLRPASQTTRYTLVRKSQKGQGFLDSRLDDLITGLVVRHKRGLLTNDLTATLDLGATGPRYIEITSVLATPILLKQEALGAVNLIRTQPSPTFTLEDQRLISGLAAAIAEFIEQAHWREQLFNENERLRQELAGRFDRQGILGRSAAMKEIFSLLDRIIPTDGRVLIQGESGTGKERIARILHDAGPRKNHPFIAVDCGALPPNLLESELFGYVRGAFTGANRDRRGLFEEANNGTLFLDEIANTSLETQTKPPRAARRRNSPVGLESGAQDRRPDYRRRVE